MIADVPVGIHVEIFYKMKTWFHYTLAIGMVITGTINTISTKAADRIETTNRHGEKALFNHPFVQAVGMFLGEFSCLLVFRCLLVRARRRNEPFPKAKPFNRAILILPALCDMTATSLMYLGLTLTYASVFQMLRGSVVIFTGIFSVLFLGRKQYGFHWLGMFLVLVGTVLVGLSNFVCTESAKNKAEAPHATVGNIIIIVAQIVVATQMVVEEKMISGYDIPALQVVGWEGAWGATILSVVVVIMYYLPQPSLFCNADSCTGRFEDVIDAFVQIGNSYLLGLAIIANMLSIAFFNFFGVSVTKHLSAATRMILDSVRTVFIWAFSMAVGWQDFCYMQVIGFVILLIGTMVYNRIFHLPYLHYPTEEEEKADQARLRERHEGRDKPLLYDQEEASSVNASSVGDESPALGLRSMQSLVETPTMGRAMALKGR